MRKMMLIVFAGAMLFGAGSAKAGSTCSPDPGPSLAMNSQTCFPTPQQCATGNYNGVYTVGAPGRGAVCVGAMGHVVVYAGGNIGTPCGAIIVADNAVTGDPTQDPNSTCS